MANYVENEFGPDGWTQNEKLDDVDQTFSAVGMFVSKNARVFEMQGCQMVYFQNQKSLFG
jgi:hypothetical protein